MSYISGVIERNIIELIKIGKVLYKKGFVSNKGGNISAKIGDLIIIKRRGARMDRLKPIDFIILPISAKNAGEASSDYFIHKTIYLLNKDINYIIHAHPKNLVVASLITDKIPLLTYDEKLLLEKDIEIIRVSNHKKLIEYIDNNVIRKGFIVEAEHGVYIFSELLINCLNLLEEIEQAAEIFLKNRGTLTPASS